MKPLSEQTIEALAEVISGGSANDSEPSIGIYRTGTKIEAWFRSFGVRFSLETGSRVSATNDTLRLAEFRAEFIDCSDLMKRIVERAADPRDFPGDPERHRAVVEYLNKRLVFDDLRLEIVGRKVRLVDIATTASVVGELSAMAETIDFDTASRDLDRALQHANADPELAATGACAVVESVCHSILIELNADIPAKQDIKGLYRALCEPLGLSPTKEGLPSEIVNDVRAVLSGLVTAVQSIGALRTHAGGAHGKQRGHQHIDARIAKLAIHSASAVALFLIETWQLRFPGRKLPNRPLAQSHSGHDRA